MKQLKMIRPHGEVLKRSLPDGFSFIFFTECSADIDAWCDICRKANMCSNPNNEEVFAKVMRSVRGIELEKDLFFVVAPDGTKIATSAIIHNKEKNSGYLHMVAAIPEYRNLGIGHAMLSFAMTIAEERGIDRCILTTDDYRLPAIKNYLVGGFCPVLYEDPESDMRARWLSVAEKLGYESLKFIEE